MSAGFLRRRAPVLPRIGDVINGTLSASGLMNGGGGGGSHRIELMDWSGFGGWYGGEESDPGESGPASIQGILTEDGIPILTEDGSWIQAENQ